MRWGRGRDKRKREPLDDGFIAIQFGRRQRKEKHTSKLSIRIVICGTGVREKKRAIIHNAVGCLDYPPQQNRTPRRASKESWWNEQRAEVGPKAIVVHKHRSGG